MSKMGHNSGDYDPDLDGSDEAVAEALSNGNASEQLRLFIERAERIAEEIKGMRDDLKDVYLEAKSQGFDPATMKAIVRLRKIERAARIEARHLLDTYAAAVGLEL